MGTNARIKGLIDYNAAILPRLQEICEPLKIFNISNFAYGKVTRNKKVFRIGTHERYTKLFYKHGMQNGPKNSYQNIIYQNFFQSHPSANSVKTVSFIWDDKNQGPAAKIRMSVDMWNGISIYQERDELVETWTFGGTLEDTELAHFYLNNMELLDKFMVYFRSAAKDLIDTSDKNKMIKFLSETDDSPTYTLDPQKIKDFNQRILTKKFRLSAFQKDFSVSARELECLQLKSHGMTAKEIARRCELSPRTVETYLTKVVMKSGLNVQQLLYLLKEEGLL